MAKSSKDASYDIGHQRRVVCRERTTAIVGHSELEKRTVDRFPHDGNMTPDNRALKSPHGAALLAAIETLYGAFEGATLSLPLQYCPHCFTENDAHYLTSTELRTLTFSDIAFILPKAKTTLGVESDINYFLPRILEALAYQAHYMEHVIPDKIGIARSAGWSDAQVAAVVAFFTTYVSAVNEMKWNTSAVYDLDEMLPRLKEVLPELPADLVAVENNAE